MCKLHWPSHILCVFILTISPNFASLSKFSFIKFSQYTVNRLWLFRLIHDFNLLLHFLSSLDPDISTPYFTTAVEKEVSKQHQTIRIQSNCNDIAILLYNRKWVQQNIHEFHVLLAIRKCFLAELFI